MTWLENSYVDETNERSINNVRSTGGTLSHAFHLFTVGSVEETVPPAHL